MQMGCCERLMHFCNVFSFLITHNGLWWQIVGAATFESQQNGFYCHKQILFGSPVWMSLSYDVPALEIYLVIHLEDILSQATVHPKRTMNCSLRSSVGWILDNSHVFVVLPFSWMCVSAYHLPPPSLPSPHVSSRLGMIYWMDPTLSPLTKPVSSQGSRLRSSSDPTWSTNTSPDSWSEFVLIHIQYIHNSSVRRVVLSHCSVHSCAYIQWLSPASAQAVTSGISSSGKLRGDVSCYNCFLICRQWGKNDLICSGMLIEKEMSAAQKG